MPEATFPGDWSVDAEGSAPPFEQLRARVLEQVSSGELPAGFRLPPVRSLAEQLGLAANTVARAYKELEADGIVETHGRGGTLVSAQGDAAHRAAQHAATEYAAKTRSLGLPSDQALALVEAALRA
ncbi:DNA-binding transcriptional regulator YhcF, GntR family [Agreia bicolorata]|uniref:DNA-binding transcriptional regulator YhcF, GntR family n=1 Tax=Agreia bicolorata TaxID=110935 RepID=A0A1T4WQ59_9MICO|nr:GntR family transcriptional regulator [Agreia bicolorata]SKA79502.1 DNA-binding transcriptional regulator YhcF, GntR family [Agreia bicolorata]